MNVEQPSHVALCFAFQMMQQNDFALKSRQPQKRHLKSGRFLACDGEIPRRNRADVEDIGSQIIDSNKRKQLR